MKMITYWLFCFKDVLWVKVVFYRILILEKHRVSSRLKLDIVRFSDAASVRPKILQAIVLGLLSTEASVVVTGLILSSTIQYVLRFAPQQSSLVCDGIK